MERVNGENRGDVVLYALSTCGWCRKTRELLEELGVEYSYVYVDMLPPGEEKDQARKEVLKWNDHQSFPTIVIDNERAIVGYAADEIREALGK